MNKIKMKSGWEPWKRVTSWRRANLQRHERRVGANICDSEEHVSQAFG